MIPALFTDHIDAATSDRSPSLMSASTSGRLVTSDREARSRCRPQTKISLTIALMRSVLRAPKTTSRTRSSKKPLRYSLQCPLLASRELTTTLSAIRDVSQF